MFSGWKATAMYLAHIGTCVQNLETAGMYGSDHQKEKQKQKVIFEENKALHLSRGNPGNHTFLPLYKSFFGLE